MVNEIKNVRLADFGRMESLFSFCLHQLFMKKINMYDDGLSFTI